MLLSYLHLLPIVEHRVSTRILQLTISSTLLSRCLRLLFIVLMSDSNTLRSVFFGLSLFIFPSEFWVGGSLLMQFVDFLNVYPIHLQCLYVISSNGSWFVLLYIRLLLMVFDQRTLCILHRESLRNTCLLLMMVVVVLQFTALQ